MIGTLLKWIMAGPLDRVLTSIDRSVDNETEREKMRLAAVEELVRVQAQMLAGPGRWFMALFILPLGAWFAAVCLYSILWCKACAYPQAWTIAALPPPLDQWAGAIVASLFAGGFAVQTARILKR